MKVGVGQSLVFSKILSSGKDVEPKQEKQEKMKQNYLQNTAFVELKRANQQVAKLQSLGISFEQIQKELGELQEFKDMQDTSQKDLNKIKGLQDKLDFLLKNTKKYKHFVISPKNLSEADKALGDIQSKIQKELEEQEKKIKQFFANVSKHDLNEKMLKDKRFREAHDIGRLSSSFADLIV